MYKIFKTVFGIVERNKNLQNEQEGADGSDLPCLNCRLIEMGEMACYTERCPQCGNVPPCRKELYPDVRNTHI